jgi:DNA-binding XRE family transcriptional regulator
VLKETPKHKEDGVDQDRWKEDRKQPCQHRGIPLPRLRAARRRAALSQRRLAELAGVSANTVRLLEGGQRGSYPATARKLARALGVAPAEVMQGHRPEQEEPLHK